MNADGGVATPDAATTDGGAEPLMSFEPVMFPIDDTEKRAILASNSVTLAGESYPIGYHTVHRSGDMSDSSVFGLLTDKLGQPILQEDNSQEISNSTDFSSLLKVGSKLFSVTHFESRPGAMYLSELAQGKDGMLTSVSFKPVDFSGVDGLWVPCAGSVTPWNTHLGSEEYPTDARAYEAAATPADLDSYMTPMLRYYGINIYPITGITKSQIDAVYSPYFHGHAVEVKVSEAGEPTVAKHYAMGRMAIELPYVMPDQKTVYITDDGTNVGFYMFVADTAGDLTAGKLYAAKWTQTSAAGEGMGAATISWVDLGHATDAEVSALIHPATGSAPKFSSIFTAAAPAMDNTCPADFKSINTEAGQECLQLVAGMELAASRLETRRYAAYLGATTEFRKEEGVTFDPDSKQLFVAISEIERGMEDGHSSNDKGGPNDIKVAKNVCGGVYAYAVGMDATIGSEYVAKSVRGLIAGKPRVYDESSLYALNTCDIDGLANPDNISVMTGYGTLLIGEDSGSGHQNDAVWAYDLTTEALTRIETTPYGSETTSVYWYPNINGFGYVRSVVQHPYGESDSDQSTGPADERAYDGYIGPFPAMN